MANISIHILDFEKIDLDPVLFAMNAQFLISEAQGNIVEQPARWHKACKVLQINIKAFA